MATYYPSPYEMLRTTFGVPDHIPDEQIDMYIQILIEKGKEWKPRTLYPEALFREIKCSNFKLK